MDTISRIMQESLKFEFSVVDMYHDLKYEYDSDTPMEEQTSCLHLHKTFVWKHIRVEAPKDFELRIDTAIPFTINIFEKLFLTHDKADIDEKDESVRDEEDGK